MQSVVRFGLNNTINVFVVDVVVVFVDGHVEPRATVAAAEVLQSHGNNSNYNHHYLYLFVGAGSRASLRFC